MKKLTIGVLGIFVYSAVLGADGYSESDRDLIAGKDFPFPTEDEAEIPEADTSQGEAQNAKPKGKAEKEYIPEVENDDNGGY
jgi:hypothetical protein